MNLPIAASRKSDPGSPSFSVAPHPAHARIRRIEMRDEALGRFFDQVRDMDVQNLEYVPFMRFVLAETLSSAMGPGFAETLRKIARKRATGGFTLDVGTVASGHQDFVKFGTAVGHLLGPANHDAMSGTFYACFQVKHTDASDSYLRQAYRLFTLHTDGTFVEEATDWLLMMKFREDNAIGGESRFLHLDDWDEKDAFQNHPLAARPLLYKAPGSKNVTAPVERPVFFHSEFGLAVSFIDQFVQPRDRQEAMYLHRLSQSMEESRGTREVTLKVGELVVLNNYFWLHGRAPFRKNPDLLRELMRQRGMFA